jgi:hypothetical protein
MAIQSRAILHSEDKAVVQPAGDAIARGHRLAAPIRARKAEEVNVLQHAMIGKRLRKELKDVAALFGRTRG